MCQSNVALVVTDASETAAVGCGEFYVQRCCRIDGEEMELNANIIFYRGNSEVLTNIRQTPPNSKFSVVLSEIYGWEQEVYDLCMLLSDNMDA